MATINSYLNFNGNTEEAFNFYKSVFGGEFSALQRFGDSPDGAPVSEKEKNMIMHISLPIGQNVLMGTDVPERMEPVIIGTNFSISVSPNSEAEATQIFNGLTAGGTVVMPLAKMFWGALFGMAKDKFGIQWMVNYQIG